MVVSLVPSNKKSKIYNLFPEHLLQNEDYRSFIDILADEYDYISELIDKLPEVSQVSKVPKRFLQYLSYLSRYKVLDSEDIDTQREILKRIFDAYGERGTEASLIKSASRSNDPNWYMEDLTYYHGPLKENSVSLEYPQYKLFTWSKSEYSRFDRYLDQNYWTDGVIIFNMTNMTRATRDAIERTIPAGRKYYFRNTIWIVSPDVTSELGTLIYKYNLWDYQNIIYYLRIPFQSTGIHISVDHPWSVGTWSGNSLLSYYQDIYKYSVSSSLPKLNELGLQKSSKYRYDLLFSLSLDSIYDNKPVHEIHAPYRLVKFVPKYKPFDDSIGKYIHVKYAIYDKFTDTLSKVSDTIYPEANIMLVSKSESIKPSNNYATYSKVDIKLYPENIMHIYEFKNSDLEIDVNKKWYGSSRWSVDFRWNSDQSILKNLSGQYTGIKDFDGKLYNIHPSDPLYNVSSVMNKKIDEYRDPFTTSDIEVSQLKSVNLLFDNITKSPIFNLYKNSHDFYEWNYRSHWKPYQSTDNYILVEKDGIGNEMYQTVTVLSGSKYTFSMMAKSNKDIKGRINLGIPTGESTSLDIHSDTNIDITTDLKRYSVSFTCTRTGKLAIKLIIQDDSASLIVGGYCLSLGSNREWTPHCTEVIYKSVLSIDSNEEVPHGKIYDSNDSENSIEIDSN